MTTQTGADGSMNPSLDDFEAMLNETFGAEDMMEGKVVEGTVVGLEKDLVVIDVGLKTEGRVPYKEFATPGARDPEINIGDKVEVYLERIENALGDAQLSREKARREESWIRLEKQFEAEEKVEGFIFLQGQRRLYGRSRWCFRVSAWFPG